MQAEVMIGLGSAGVAGLAVVASTVTTILSLRGQRENTRATLEAQRALVSTQEAALRERTRSDAVRSQRAALYKTVIIWAEGLLGALSAMAPEQGKLAPGVWHIDPTTEADLDLYASDVVHTRFNALRGLLLGLVDGSGFADSPLVAWSEHGGHIQSVEITRTPPLDSSVERQKVRDKARADAFSLISAIRAEVQGDELAGYFVSYRLDRS